MASSAAHRSPAGELAEDCRKAVSIWADLFSRHELLTYASAIARSMVVAAVAVMLLLIGLAGESGRRDLWTTHLAPQVHKRFLPDVYAGINQTVLHIFKANSPGLIAFAAVLAVWEVSGAVRGVSGALNRIYEVKENRSWKRRFPLSFALALAVVLAVIGAILLIMVVGGAVHGAVTIPFAIVRWVAAIALIAFTFGLLVRFAPAQRRAKRWASLGAAIVVAGWLLEAFAFKWYVTGIANFRTAAGSLTVLILAVGFLYTASIILLVAIELDELLREKRGKGERTVFYLARLLHR